MDAPRCVLSEMIKNLPLPKDTALFIVQILLSTYSLSKKTARPTLPCVISQILF